MSNGARRAVAGSTKLAGGWVAFLACGHTTTKPEAVAPSKTGTRKCEVCTQGNVVRRERAAKDAGQVLTPFHKTQVETRYAAALKAMEGWHAQRKLIEEELDEASAAMDAIETPAAWAKYVKAVR